MSRPAYMLYFLYTRDAKEYVDTCLGQKELCEFLGRDKNSVQNTLWKIKKGKLNHIRDNNGNVYTIITEEDLRGKPKRKKVNN